MSKPIRFILALHNHQPIGNFEHVFENAYRDSYLPFLDTFEPYESLKIALHTSGSLMEWLDAKHPEYVDRLAGLVHRGRIEILGGPFYEPILAMIPSRDRVGQVCAYTRWLEDRLGCSVRGMWVPERVWEQNYVRDLSAAGIEYSILDDFHFKASGLVDDQLFGHYLTEDDGRIMSIFPGSERLRYLIPFGQPHETIEYLRSVAAAHEDAVVVFGDDGEKFGTWPETNRHCYQDGWLRRFFDHLAQNQDWIHLTTPSEAVDNIQPLGRVYLPTCSYREMTEWALPAGQQIEFDRIAHEMQNDPRWNRRAASSAAVTGGTSRVRYPDSNDMYADDAGQQPVARARRRRQDRPPNRAGPVNSTVSAATASTWARAFGASTCPDGNAVYEHLIKADNLLDVFGLSGQLIEAKVEDSAELRRPPRSPVSQRPPRRITSRRPPGGTWLSLMSDPSATTCWRRRRARPRSLPSQGARRSEPVGRAAMRQHPPRHLQARGARPGPVRRLSPQEPDRLVFRCRCPASTALPAPPATKDFVAGDYDARVRRNPDRIQVH